jgi:hypothetical protein|tara:strand:- start:353 stop:562 length:210 start_codon:yes stop_codon:yes gene_type:complete
MNNDLFQILVLINLASVVMVIALYGAQIIAAIQGDKEGAKPNIWHALLGLPAGLSFILGLGLLINYMFL